MPDSRILSERPDNHLLPSSTTAALALLPQFRSIACQGFLGVETNSLFPIAGNLSLRQQESFESSALCPPEESTFEEFPCIFPTNQGIAPRDQFAPPPTPSTATQSVGAETSRSDQRMDPEKLAKSRGVGG